MVLPTLIDSHHALHSVHLEVPQRRAEYRAARDRLLGLCGELTLMGQPPGDPKSDAPTLAGPAGVPMAYFLAVGGEEFPLKVGINTVGRLSGNAVTIGDEHVSRRHCAVVLHKDGRVELHDVASKNGTLLNGQRIPGPKLMQPGDVITLCTRRAILVARPAADPLDGLLPTTPPISPAPPTPG